MIADLHTHSTASDGQYTPAELAGLAKQRGIEVLAVTDHDTIDGVPEAMAEGPVLVSGFCGVWSSAPTTIYICTFWGIIFRPNPCGGSSAASKSGGTTGSA